MTSPLPSVSFLPLGAIIKSIEVNGKNIVQGFPTSADYVAHNSPYFGETIGRIANRISSARVNHLNSQSYQLSANNGSNSLHGGVKGWGKRDWKAENTKRASIDGTERDAVLFTLTSKHEEEGFPGTVEAKVWYMPHITKEDGVDKTILEMEYEAQLIGDEVGETAVGMTNHSYFNLAQAPDISGTEVTLSTIHYQKVDDGGIPTGPIIEYPGLAKDKTFTLGSEKPDIDDCFISNLDPSSIPLDTRPQPLDLKASFYHPSSRIHLEVLSTEPAFQFYTGKYIDVPAVPGQPARGKRSGFCVEPSRYVNAVNVDEHKSMVILRQGERYGTRIVYRTWES
ncbi:galactose mutarotase-like protein [Pseudovirgaria hyperparasitica]|uniref:Galactose mutarotase-like protein n=1 Tax=Pseudovirgaria hyperparasitica TaxID=470096 RepID=A0A6A6WFF1_9PEZI|nr:galactose mutarotase-like protein [Pseudovirgaria hyperparasitica]KAF2760889.1 galactose mutarotase-like protein [Pseudovirgaria hyperparasitica]